MDMTSYLKRAPRKTPTKPKRVLAPARPDLPPSAFTIERISDEFSLLIAAARAGRLPMTAIDICHPLPIRVSDPNAAVVKCLEQFETHQWIDGFWLWDRLREIQKGIGW